MQKIVADNPCLSNTNYCNELSEKWIKWLQQDTCSFLLHIFRTSSNKNIESKRVINITVYDYQLLSLVLIHLHNIMHSVSLHTFSSSHVSTQDRPCTQKVYTLFFIRNLAKGLVLKVPYFRTSFYQILVLKVP